MHPVKKKICVVSSTRADYGLLYHLMKAIDASRFLELHLVVTGSHLSAQHGYTYKLIVKDGFRIRKKINILSDNGRIGVGKAAGTATDNFCTYFCKEKPDAVVLLGDRFEILSVAQAAAIAIIPVIHLHGGEISEGANDDLFRHAITKLSSFHFTSNHQHRNRVVQMGEQPSRVKTTGAMGLENIRELSLLTKDQLEKKYQIRFAKKKIVVTFHPATLDRRSPSDQFRQLLGALRQFDDATFIFSRPNADAGGDVINRLIDTFALENGNCLVSSSFGQVNYLSLMKLADLVIGNSSSGIIEAPSLFTPTVNIGQRQKGRTHARSVIHCACETPQILAAMRKAIGMKKSKAIFKNPYDFGNASVKIVKQLEKIDYTRLLPKKFHDIL